jgi:aldose 1-epimerase
MRFQIMHDHAEGWDRVRLHDALTGCHADIIPSAGAILNAFSIPTSDGECNVIEGFRDAADWRERVTKGFQSAKLSPFVCRLRNSSYEWNGRHHTIRKFLLNGTAIHGLIYDAPYQIIEEAVHADYAELELKYAYKGDAEGFPFPFDCLIRYRLEPGHTLLVSTAIHNRSSETIPMSDGWHPYFALGGLIDDLTLQFHASQMLEYDDEILPSGRLVPNTDWNAPRRIGDAFLDNGFVLDDGHPQPSCTLSDPRSGVYVSFLPEASYPYLQIYTPPHRRSIAIENLSAAPDAFNNGIGLTRLEPDHTRTYNLRYRIGKA